MALPIAGLGLRLGGKAASSLIPSGGGPRGFNINVETDIREAQRMLKRGGERNVPLAIAQSLTATAKHLRKVQRRQMSKYMDRPSKWTKNSLNLEMAKWRDYHRGTMYARVFARDDKHEYLKYVVYGGRRTPTRRALRVPGNNARLNRFGNLTKNYIDNELKKPNTFMGNVNGVAGLWRRGKRTGRGQRLTLLVLFTDEMNFKGGQWPFFRISERIVDRELPKQINKAVRRALNKGR